MSTRSPLFVCRGGLNTIGAVFAAVALFAVVVANPAAASMNKTRIMERDGQIIVVSQDVGNQALTMQWVENDERRRSDAGTTLTYAIDQTELPPGISWPQLEAAIESAVATFNALPCGREFELVRVDSDPTADLGVMQHLAGFGGSPTKTADITFAGWLPQEFMTALGVGRPMGLAVPALFDAADETAVWGGDAFDPTREFTDINGDRKFDLFARELYFNTAGNFVVDDDDLANTLFYIDVESIVLHELGHALGMAHFGRTKVILDENGDLVDVVLNRNSTPMMNADNFFVNREVSGSDRASFCGIYGSWGK